MIIVVSLSSGAPNIAGFIGLGAAVDWIEGIGIERIGAVESELGDRAVQQLMTVPGLRLFGTAQSRVPVYPFVIDGAHAHDMATLLDHEGVGVRSGQHCAHPLLQSFGVSATLRASLACYNTRDELDAFIAALNKVRAFLA